MGVEFAKGATIMYRKYIEPWLVENESMLDDFVAQLGTLRLENVRHAALPLVPRVARVICCLNHAMF